MGRVFDFVCVRETERERELKEGRKAKLQLQVKLQQLRKSRGGWSKETLFLFYLLS
jgi:hypothetical protein